MTGAHRRLARLARLALGAYLALLAWGLLAPTPEGPSALVAWMDRAGSAVGLPPALTASGRMELVANVLVVAPVPVLAVLGGVPRAAGWDWRGWTSWAFVVSVGVEVVQAVLLPARSAAHVDIVANTAGGLLGAQAVSLGRWLATERGRAFDRRPGRWLR